VDGGATCTITYTTPALANGAHTLSVRATDAAGNVDPTPATYTWGISTTSPVTTIATKPKNPSKDPTGDFTFTNTVSTVTYECKLDSGAWTTCGASYTTPTLVDGPHTLSVRSSESITDAGVIVEDPPVTYTWTIDTVAPDTTIATKPSDPSSSATGVFTFTSNEDPVTYACKLDTGDWASCTASYTTPELANGSHTLAVRATDTAGNVDASPATYTWSVEGSSVDGGVPDGGFVVALDGALVSTVDAERLDTQGVDFASPRDLAPALDVGKIDNASADLLPEVQLAGPEPGPDAAPEPNPDTAAPVVKEDAAEPIANKDAAPASQDVKIMGAGFCAIASPQSTTPAPFLVLGLAALALLRRRRKS
jgi:MYXO-CTERM domain-containing protein